MNEENKPASSQGRWLSEFLDGGFSYSIHSSGLLKKFRSVHQDIEIHDSDTFGRLLCLNGSFMTSERDEFLYHENLVHVAACSHEDPVDALIIGGGDGGAAEELLKHSTIRNVSLVEIDGAVIEAARQYLQKVHQGVLDAQHGDARLHVHVEDGLAYIKKNAGQFDLVILDLTDPGGFSLPLYTPEFYHSCAARLKPDGIMSLHVSSPFIQQGRMISILKNLKQVFNIVCPYLTSIPLYGGWWMMACVSHSVYAAGVPAQLVDSRLQRRGVKGLQYYNGCMHQAAMAMPNFIRDALAAQGIAAG